MHLPLQCTTARFSQADTGALEDLFRLALHLQHGAIRVGAVKVDRERGVSQPAYGFVVMDRA
jgi:hypothetical protein